MGGKEAYRGALNTAYKFLSKLPSLLSLSVKKVSSENIKNLHL